MPAIPVDPNQLYSLSELSDLLFPGGDAPRNLRHQLIRQGVQPLSFGVGRDRVELWPGRTLLCGPAVHAEECAEPSSSDEPEPSTPLASVARKTLPF